MYWLTFRAQDPARPVRHGKEKLHVGAVFAITIEDIEGTVERCSTTYKGLARDVRPGDMILIDDGRIALRATEVTDTDDH